MGLSFWAPLSHGPFPRQPTTILLTGHIFTMVHTKGHRKTNYQRIVLSRLTTFIHNPTYVARTLFAKMSTTFEPRLSTSVMRAPFSSADAPSMADSLPSINFGFDDLRDRMAKFTVRFDNFIEQGRKRVLEERNQFRMNIVELQGHYTTPLGYTRTNLMIEDQRMKKKDIEILSSKASTHQQMLSKEAAETNEMKAAIASLTAQRDSHQATRESLKQQIAETQKEIGARLAAQRAYAQHVNSQSRFNIPELEFWNSTLSLTIEGAGLDDRIKFIYTHIDNRDWTKEAWFELDTSKRDYEIPHCKPKLEKEKIERVLEKVNEGRSLQILLKGMRDLFKEAMSE